MRFSRSLWRELSAAQRVQILVARDAARMERERRSVPRCQSEEGTLIDFGLASPCDLGRD